MDDPETFFYTIPVPELLPDILDHITVFWMNKLDPQITVFDKIGRSISIYFFAGTGYLECAPVHGIL